MTIRRNILIATATAAGIALSALAAPSAATSAASAPRSVFWSESSTAPLSYVCSTTSVPTASLMARRVANYTYRFDILVNGVVTRTGSAKASSTGWITARQNIANARTSQVQLKLNGHSAVSGIMTPR